MTTPQLLRTILAFQQEQAALARFRHHTLTLRIIAMSESLRNAVTRITASVEGVGTKVTEEAEQVRLLIEQLSQPNPDVEAAVATLTTLADHLDTISTSIDNIVVDTPPE